MRRVLWATGRFLKNTRLVESFGVGADFLSLLFVLGVFTAAEIGWLGELVEENSVAVAASALAVLFLVAGVRGQLKLDRRMKPHLYFTRIAAGPTAGMIRRVTTADPITFRLTGQYHEITNAFAVAAFVANAPDTFSKEAGVQRAVVNVRFYDESDMEQGPIWESSEGSWGDNPGPANFDRGTAPKDTFTRRDLPANGEEHRIDVALKFDGSERLIPWCVPYLLEDSLHPEGFGEGSYVCQFTITGEGLDAPFTRRFRIRNPHGTADPKVEELHYLRGN